MVKQDAVSALKEIINTHSQQLNMISDIHWGWLTALIIFPIFLTLWNFMYHRKGAMFFLAVEFLAKGNLAKLAVVGLYLLWSIGAHQRYSKLGKKISSAPPKTMPVTKKGRWPKCLRPPGS